MHVRAALGEGARTPWKLQIDTGKLKKYALDPSPTNIKLGPRMNAGMFFF